MEQIDHNCMTKVRFKSLKCELCSTWVSESKHPQTRLPAHPIGWGNFVPERSLGPCKKPARKSLILWSGRFFPMWFEAGATCPISLSAFLGRARAALAIIVGNCSRAFKAPSGSPSSGSYRAGRLGPRSRPIRIRLSRHWPAGLGRAGKKLFSGSDRGVKISAAELFGGFSGH
jgi:hypothetical protein